MSETTFANPDNADEVQAAFNALAKGRTVIMIAHRKPSRS